MLYDCMISTKDNPFDPFDDFEAWLMFDKEKGYNSSERVARLAHFTEDMTEEESDKEFERAMDRLIEIDPFDIFIKIRRKSETNAN